MMNNLKVRDVAMLPGDHTAEERREVFHMLLASAAKNKDRACAAADMRLAATLPTSFENA